VRAVYVRRRQHAHQVRRYGVHPVLPGEGVLTVTRVADVRAKVKARSQAERAASHLRQYSQSRLGFITHGAKLERAL
jgi:hypothetical protein